jgi:ATP-GRASP peptide maturase of grasp-with-spasm system
MNAFGNAFLSSIVGAKWFDHPENVRKNRKMEILVKAKEFNLLIPNTIIANNKKSALQFLSQNKRIISKPITEIPYFHDIQYEFFLFTSEMTEDILNSGPANFYPTLFQQLIEKKYDIRVFFMNDECYSMAILSQNDSKTTIDFRNYDFERPSRTIPYKLPAEIENKICKLMRSINLSNGSLDFVLSQDHKFYFLEVNPIGQFGMTSYPCNYEIDKKIAQFLVNYDRQQTQS